MKKFLALLISALGLVANVTATPYDHIHLTAPDAIEAAQWYSKHFGGRLARFRDSQDTSLPLDRVMYGNIAVIWFGREPEGGSAGTGVDHFGFSVSNVEEVLNSAVADGATALAVLGLARYRVNTFQS